MIETQVFIIKDLEREHKNALRLKPFIFIIFKISKIITLIEESKVQSRDICIPT